MIRGHGRFILPCALIALSGNARTAPAETRKISRTTGTAPIAVVELFTSDKCPNCPAADEYLSDIAASARRNGQQVYPLAFHVDYWSPPGRQDPYSSQDYVERQKDYARAMGLDQCYTPQMIVNGTEEFVGSRRQTGDDKINSALEQPARVGIKVAAHSDRADATHQVAVEYEVASAPEGSVVNIALVENNATSKKGRDYVNVVRAFRTVSLSAEGKHSTSIKAPSAAVASNCSIIAYVQNPRTRAVLGAAKAELREEATGQALLQIRD